MQFSELESRIEAMLAQQQRKPLFASNEKMGGVAMLLGASTALLGANVVPVPYGEVIAIFGLTVELLACLVMIWFAVRNEPLSFKASRAEFAAELDRDFISGAEIIKWLSTFPRSVLEVRRQYVRHRRAALEQRRTFVIGSLDRIGLLPLIAAIYLQVKDLRVGEPVSIGWLSGLFVLVMIALYWVGVLAFTLKLRLAAYDALLSDALTVPGSLANDALVADTPEDNSNSMPKVGIVDLR